MRHKEREGAVTPNEVVLRTLDAFFLVKSTPIELSWRASLCRSLARKAYRNTSSLVTTTQQGMDESISRLLSQVKPRHRRQVKFLSSVNITGRITINNAPASQTRGRLGIEAIARRRLRTVNRTGHDDAFVPPARLMSKRNRFWSVGRSVGFPAQEAESDDRSSRHARADG